MSDGNSQKRKHILSPASSQEVPAATSDDSLGIDEADSTDTKLALLLSIHPGLDISNVLEALIASNGSVSAALSLLSSSKARPRKVSKTGHQTALASYLTPSPNSAAKVQLPRKGETLHLYTAASIAAAIPSTLFPAFLPVNLANELLRELLKEAETFAAPKPFSLFERAVISPHTACFFLRENASEDEKQHYSYQARALESRTFTSSMAAVTEKVEEVVNAAMRPSKPWKPNAAFVNCYRGKHQSVGYHTDELTYLGPRAIIASVSLGCEREFRVRRVIRKDDEDTEVEGEGQYSIHLPHNSLLIMHGGMQEGWKHSIHPATKLTPHPIAADVRINITYRYYRKSLKPGTAPLCACRLNTTLRPVFAKEGEEQKYFWSCAGGYQVDGDGKGCGFFQYAEFDDDGELIQTS